MGFEGWCEEKKSEEEGGPVVAGAPGRASRPGCVRGPWGARGLEWRPEVLVLRRFLMVSGEGVETEGFPVGT